MKNVKIPSFLTPQKKSLHRCKDFYILFNRITNARLKTNAMQSRATCLLLYCGHRVQHNTNMEY